MKSRTQGITIPKKTRSIWYFVFYVLYYIRYFTGAVLSPRAPGGRAHLETANKTHMENSAVCDRSHRRDAGATPVAGRSRYDSLTPLTLSLCKTIQLYRYRHRYLTCDWSGMTGGLKFGTRGACIWPQGVWPVQIKLPGELKFGT